MVKIKVTAIDYDDLEVVKECFDKFKFDMKWQECAIVEYQDNRCVAICHTLAQLQSIVSSLKRQLDLEKLGIKIEVTGEVKKWKTLPLSEELEQKKE